MARRAYDNTLRAEFAEQTRLRLLNAVRDVLADGSDAQLTMSAVAARAGVSEPTAYRHFPTRDALLEAAAIHVAREMGEPPLADDLDDLPAFLIALSRYFERNAAWMRAALKNPHGGELRASGRKRRVAAMRGMLEPRMAHLEPRERELVMGVVLSLVRLETWDFATRTHGLSPDEAGRAVGWAMGALLDALDRGRRAKRATLLDDATVARGRAWQPDDMNRMATAASPTRKRRGR